MKAASMMACIAAPLAAAMAVRRAADATTECYPSDYVLTDFTASGEATNSTTYTITEASFSYVDSDTGLSSTCGFNSTSTNLSPGGAYANYACDSPLLQFSWGKVYDSEDYLLGVSETVCNSTATTAGSFVPNLTCQDCADGTGVECSLNSTTQSVKFSSWDPITG
ncbi:hypothetical protein N0V93_001243 [Gnomoniopsis smithogilvyi]|uniref:Uncharacterized protein n=1 Tax=Gnomoniopsis smithogilvyi TaxID=1191159 RepID=A0A9W8Z568_9PEZI|nr:hypothetical protein N0V93_001243 [Gnomoniopsis smithogilvyi]